MSNFALLYKYTKPYKVFIAIIFATIIISSFAVLSLGQGLRHVIDHGFLTEDGYLFKMLLTIVSTIIIMSIAIFTRICLISYSSERIIANIRMDAYAHILTLPQIFFEKVKVGEILSTLISDTATLQLVTSGALSNALRNATMLIGSMIMLLNTSIKLSFYSFIAIPPIILIISLMGRRVRKLSKIARDSIANITSYSEETLNGVKTIQAFTYEQNAQEHFSMHVKHTLRCFVKYEYMRAWLVVLIIITVLSAIGFIIAIGSNDMISGNITSGTLSAFMFYAILAANSISRLGEIFSELQQAGAAIHRLQELFNQKNTTLIESKVPISTPNTIDNIIFSQVTFHYPSDNNKPLISNLSFEINAGEKVAIVGPSGAGKSTIFNLLLRFYDVSSGTITINGTDIKDFSLYQLRQLIANVPQDPYIFSNTIEDNILYGKPTANHQEVVLAAQRSHAFEFIKNLDDQFLSFTGEKGVKLSGGQRQRISIARAMLRQSKILLLDEATSSLDTENEKLIQESLKTLSPDTIIITIAHRLSTVINADKIIVINQGKIMEIGTHKSLLAKGGLYKHLISLQNIA